MSETTHDETKIIANAGVGCGQAPQADAGLAVYASILERQYGGGCPAKECGLCWCESGRCQEGHQVSEQPSGRTPGPHPTFHERHGEFHGKGRGYQGGHERQALAGVRPAGQGDGSGDGSAGGRGRQEERREIRVKSLRHGRDIENDPGKYVANRGIVRDPEHEGDNQGPERVHGRPERRDGEHLGGCE